MTSGALWARTLEFRVLPKPARIVDAQGRQWAGYTLDQAKRLLEYDSELYTLRLQKEIWDEARRGYQGQVDLLKEIIDKEQEKYGLLNDRFLEKSKLLDTTIEEKNRFKYRRSWALFGGRSSFISGLLILGLGVAVAR